MVYGRVHVSTLLFFLKWKAELILVFGFEGTVCGVDVRKHDMNGCEVHQFVVAMKLALGFNRKWLRLIWFILLTLSVW